METEDSLALIDLVPLETLQTIRNLFETVVGVSMVFTDASGKALMEVPRPLSFCGSLVDTGLGDTICLRRKKWDVPEPKKEAGIRSQHGGTHVPLAHRCLGGFRDTAVPIIVQDETLGYAVFARSLPTEPDIDAFRQMAEHAGMDPEVGEAVANSAVVMPAERIRHVADFLQVIAELVARAAYDTLKAQKIIELEGLRDSLVHMIVHDLRTPLTSIMGGLDMVVSTEYEDGITREFVPMALNSSQTLLEMVNTLLDINKMESGQMRLLKSAVNIESIVDEALLQVKGLAREHEHELCSEVDGRCKPLQADAEKLRRLVVNLLGNAIKFTPDGGRIKASAVCEGNTLRIAISDNGPGIPPEYQARIFEKFGQVEARAEGHKHSTGLGLTFCKMVAEAHGGSIRVESTLGKGSDFIVELPLGPPEET